MFRVGQHVRISKEKMRFTNAADQNFSIENFRVAKIIKRRPRVIYIHEDLNGTPIDDQFYREEMTPVRIADRPVYKINKILDRKFRRGIREYIVRWRG